LDELKLKRRWFETQTIRVPVGEISGATDNLVPKCSLEEMVFSGGGSAAVDFSTEETALSGVVPTRRPLAASARLRTTTRESCSIAASFNSQSSLNARFVGGLRALGTQFAPHSG
jgi:hypothetical protein